MPKFTFRGAFVRFADLRYDEKSKLTYLKINFTADFTEPIRQAMEWGEPPAGFESADLDGEYAATHVVLTPGRGQDAQELQISAQQIGEFSFHRVKSKDGESVSNELRFQIVTTDPEATGKLREYLAVVGKGTAQLKVNYAAQSEIEFEGEKGDEKEADSQPELVETGRRGGARAGRASRDKVN